jgi:hypothetical protein
MNRHGKGKNRMNFLKRVWSNVSDPAFILSVIIIATVLAPVALTLYAKLKTRVAGPTA